MAAYRLQCALLINNPVGLAPVGHISSKDNEIADRISRFHSLTEALLGFEQLSQDFPQLRYCKRFQPNAELISFVLDALLNKKLQDPLQIAQQLLANPGKLIT